MNCTNNATVTQPYNVVNVNLDGCLVIPSNLDPTFEVRRN